MHAPITCAIVKITPIYQNRMKQKTFWNSILNSQFAMKVSIFDNRKHRLTCQLIIWFTTAAIVTAGLIKALETWPKIWIMSMTVRPKLISGVGVLGGVPSQCNVPMQPKNSRIAVPTVSARTMHTSLKLSLCITLLFLLFLLSTTSSVSIRLLNSMSVVIFASDCWWDYMWLWFDSFRWTDGAEWINFGSTVYRIHSLSYRKLSVRIHR